MGTTAVLGWDQQDTGQLCEWPRGLAREQLAGLLTGDSIFNLCHICKVGSVWDAQTPHAVSMAPLLEEKGRDNVKRGLTSLLLRCVSARS